MDRKNIQDVVNVQKMSFAYKLRSDMFTDILNNSYNVILIHSIYDKLWSPFPYRR